MPWLQACDRAAFAWYRARLHDPAPDTAQLFQRAVRFERASKKGGPVAIEIEVTVTV